MIKKDFREIIERIYEEIEKASETGEPVIFAGAVFRPYGNALASRFVVIGERIERFSSNQQKCIEDITLNQIITSLVRENDEPVSAVLQ